LLFPLRQCAAIAKWGELCEIEHNYLRGKLIAITAYYGSLVNDGTKQQWMQVLLLLAMLLMNQQHHDYTWFARALSVCRSKAVS
jgi:hypothetical protein